MHSRVMVAYEPVWSIGVNGTPATVEDVAEAIGLIRNRLSDQLGERASQIPLLYGGSVNLDNCADYAAIEHVDGLFVGRAARTAKGYLDVLERSYAARIQR
jgi:triosephosphate isomerase